MFPSSMCGQPPISTSLPAACLARQFRRIRYFGLLANRQRAQLLNLCRSHLQCTATPQATVGMGHLCQHCHRGTMREVEILSPNQLSAWLPDPPVENSS
jgi:hypothetical protein